MAGEWPEGMWEGARWFFLVRDIHWVLFETKNDGVVSGSGTRTRSGGGRVLVVPIEGYKNRRFFRIFQNLVGAINA